MQRFQIRNDTLIEIATFLVRRWSERENVTIEFSNLSETKTRILENRIILLPFEKLSGNDFERYRQFRTILWYEAMRMKFCKKILSNDHAFGFILNTIENYQRKLKQLRQGKPLAPTDGIDVCHRLVPAFHGGHRSERSVT